MYSESFLLFMRNVEQAKLQLNFLANEEVFFRGHSKEDYQLLPNIFRPLNQGFTKAKLWENESDTFYEFRARAKEVHSGDLSDWDILFFMQHHGAKTRLLDWSESFGVALYFALLNYDPATCTPCIWILNPYRLNELYHDSRDLFSPENLDDWLPDDDEDEDDYEWSSYSDYLLYDNPDEVLWQKPVALYPIRRVDRLTTQGGYFTIHGTDVRPIEKIIPENRNVWKKIRLPDQAVPDAQRFLEQAGINHFTMFPDLDGLANYLNKKYYNSWIV